MKKPQVPVNAIENKKGKGCSPTSFYMRNKYCVAKNIKNV